MSRNIDWNTISEENLSSLLDVGIKIKADEDRARAKARAKRPILTDKEREEQSRRWREKADREAKDNAFFFIITTVAFFALFIFSAIRDS